jgi:hypothetical protein
MDVDINTTDADSHNTMDSNDDGGDNQLDNTDVGVEADVGNTNVLYGGPLHENNNGSSNFPLQ